MIYMTKVRQRKIKSSESLIVLTQAWWLQSEVGQRRHCKLPSLLNSSFVLQQSELFADRIVSDKIDPHQRVTRAWQLCYQRDPENERFV